MSKVKTRPQSPTPKEVKSGKKTPGELESYMTSGEYASMGKTWMVKRNIEYFLKEAS